MGNKFDCMLTNTLSSVYNHLRQLLFYFVRYRIHLSLIFAFLLYYNNLTRGKDIDVSLILSFSFWHFSLFLFDRVYDRKMDSIAQPDEFIPDYQAKALYLLVVACLAGSFAFFMSSGKSLVYWFLLFPITFLYTVPVYKGIRAKNIFLVKNLYSAILIYGLPLVMHSMLLNNENYSSSNISAISSLIIYVLIGEIFWDIRDSSVDKANNIHTLPNVIGLWPTKFIMAALIIADMYKSGFHVPESGIIYLVLLTFTNERTDRLVFHLPPLIALLRFCL